MFDAVVPVEDTCFTDIGKIVPAATFENVTLEPSPVRTARLPPTPTYNALASVLITESAGVIENAVDAQESADFENIIIPMCL